MLPLSAGRTAFRSATLPHSLAAVTVPAVRAEPDQARLVAIPLADKLAERELSVGPHFSRPCVPDMGIVGPHHYSGRWDIVVAVQMLQQCLKGLHHVLVTQVPRGDTPAEHRAVVHLRVAHRLCILLGVKQLVLGEQSVPARIGQCIALNFDQLLDGLIFTRWTGAERRRKAVRLTIVGRSVVEARIALPRPCRRPWVDLVKVGNHLVHGPMQAVEIQSVEAGLPLTV